MPSSPISCSQFNKEDWGKVKVIYREHYTKVTVYIHKETRQVGALKIYRRSKMTEREIQRKESDFEREVQVHYLMDGMDHILPLWFWYKTNHEWGLMTKYMNHSFLLSRIYSFKTTECILHSVIYPLLKAVQSLHFQNMIHRDIKPENIFIHHHKLYLGDFGYSYCLSSEEPKCTHLAGTLNYMAPELLEHYLDKSKPLSYAQEVDIWSIGIIVYEMFFHQKPFGWSGIKHYIRDDPTRPTFIRSCLNKPLTFPSMISSNVRDFIERCLEQNPHQRATITELIQHPWIQTYLKNKKDKLYNQKCLLEIQTSIPTPIVPLHPVKKAKTSSWTNRCSIF